MSECVKCDSRVHLTVFSWLLCVCGPLARADLRSEFQEVVHSHDAEGGGGCAVGVRIGQGLDQHSHIKSGYEHRIMLSHSTVVTNGGVHIGSVWLKDSQGLSLLLPAAGGLHSLQPRPCV